MGADWIQGGFTGVEGTLHMDPEEPLGATCRGEIDVRRLRPGSPRLNTELRIQDFLDAERHPRIPFAATVTERLGEATFTAMAEVVIRGSAHTLRLDVAYLGQETTRISDLAHSQTTAPRVALEARARLTPQDLGAPLPAAAAAKASANAAIELFVEINAVLDPGVQGECGAS